MADPILLLDAVKPGDALPPLSYDVTTTTVILGALATRDWRPCTTTRTSRSIATARATSS